MYTNAPNFQARSKPDPREVEILQRRIADLLSRPNGAEALKEAMFRYSNASPGGLAQANRPKPGYAFGGFIGAAIEDTWKDTWDSAKDIVKSPVFQAIAPIALSILAPGLGTALGAALGASATWAPVLGNALISGGIAAAGGRNPVRGAITGGVAGGLGRMGGELVGLSGDTANVVGSSVLSGAGSSLTGGDFGSGAVQGGLGALAQNMSSEYLNKETIPQSSPEFEGPPAPTSSQQLGGVNLSSAKVLPMALALSGSRQPEYATYEPPSRTPYEGGPIPEMDFDRPFQGDDLDYYTYGQVGGEHQFFSQNQLPPPAEVQAKLNEGWTYVNGQWIPPHQSYAARGGLQLAHRLGGHHVRGPGSGRDDAIDANLSDGEYVIDAETVALLGDGSTDAGAERLDQMRINLRKHKGEGLARGQFSADAKPPEAYLPRGRRYAKGGKITSGFEKVHRALSSYLGDDFNPNRVSIVEDPWVSGTYAARVETGDNYPSDFLIHTLDDVDPMDQVEEVEFKSWPPKTRYARGGRARNYKRGGLVSTHDHTPEDLLKLMLEEKQR